MATMLLTWLKHKHIQRSTVIFIILVAVLCATRFWQLGHKPYHHDESLYAVTSWRYATQGVYTFNPMLHGPLLFTLQAGLFKILPINDFTGRLPSALFGLLLALSITLLSQRWHQRKAVIALAAVTFSPTLCYFSRFLGMDIVLATLGVLVVLTVDYYRQSHQIYWLYLTSALIACMVATKLNFLFYIFPLLSFPMLWYLMSKKNRRAVGNPWWRKLGTQLTTLRWNLLVLALIMMSIFIILYSSMGSHWPGVWDGLYRKMIPYWLHQHRIQRIGGSFDYYLPLLVVYEWPLLLSFVLLMAQKIWRPAKRWRRLTWVAGAPCLLTLLALALWPSIGSILQKFLHMDQPWHVFLASLLITSGGWVIREHVVDKQLMPAFTLYWLICSLLLYAYAGEKVPWLLVHIVVPLLLYVVCIVPSDKGMRRSDYRRASVSLLVAATLFWQLMSLTRSSLLAGADPRERLVYTHTSYDVSHIVNQINHLASITGDQSNLAISVMGHSQAVWPMNWYLRDYNRWFQFDNQPPPNSAVVIDDWERRDQTSQLLGQSFSVERYKLREWWVPDSNAMSSRGLLRYFFLRETYNPTGSSDIVVFIRQDLMPYWRSTNR